MNPKVDEYLRQATQWREETEALRKLLLASGLSEELKWGKPCYSFQNSNVVIIQGFKAYCALLFFKGVLLKDPQGILTKVGENTRVGRQIRFTHMREIVKLEPVLKAYVQAAIEVEKAGMKVPVAEDTPRSLPEELQGQLDKNPALKAAFQALTPGRQRAYLFYFSGAKQATTREARVAKCIPQILQGKGLDDDYRSRK